MLKPRLKPWAEQLEDDHYFKIALTLCVPSGALGGFIALAVWDSTYIAVVTGLAVSIASVAAVIRWREVAVQVLRILLGALEP